AEDGIRDRNVTGVQTCALPIFFPINLRLTKVYDVIRPNTNTPAQAMTVIIKLFLTGSQICGVSNSNLKFSKLKAVGYVCQVQAPSGTSDNNSNVACGNNNMIIANIPIVTIVHFNTGLLTSLR